MASLLRIISAHSDSGQENPLLRLYDCASIHAFWIMQETRWGVCFVRIATSNQMACFILEQVSGMFYVRGDSS